MRLGLPQGIAYAQDMRVDPRPEVQSSIVDGSAFVDTLHQEFLSPTIEGLRTDDEILDYVESQLHRWPPSISGGLQRFRRYGGPLGFRLLTGLVLQRDVPATRSVRGRVREGAAADAEALLAAAAMLLGDPFGHRAQSGGALIHDCRPSRAHASSVSIGDNSSVPVQLHTDGASHPFQPDFVLLYCLRGAQDARTIVVPVDLALASLDAATVAILHEPRFRFRPDPEYAHDVDIDPSVWSDRACPVLCRSPNGASFVRFDFDLVTAIDPEAEQALARFDEAAWRNSLWVALAPGDLLVLDQRRTLHARTPFRPAFSADDRWLKLCYVSRDLFRPCPQIALNGRVVDALTWEL